MKHKLFTLLLAMFASIGTMFAETYSGSCGENLTWSLNTEDSVLTIRGTGAMADYANKRAPWYNNRQSIVSAIIENNVTSIGDYAFYECYALSSVTIGNGVTSIGSKAFKDCWWLTSVNIPNNVTYIGEDAFVNCSSLPVIDNIRYADTYIVETVDKTISSISFKNGTKWIGKSAFYDCDGLTSVIIPSGVTNIGDYAFGNCSNLTSIEIPNSVINIGYKPFTDCAQLTTVHLNSDTIVGYYGASSYYDNIGSIFGSQVERYVIGNDVTTIGAGAFSNCKSMTSIEIPNSVTSIGSQAFYNCTGLTSVTNYAETPQPINANVFSNVDLSACTLYVPAESVEAYQTADVWKEFTNILPIGESSDSCVIASGTCGAQGDNLTWTLTCDSVLTISGMGAIKKFNSTSRAPWYEYRESIKFAVIEEGVTSIGNLAFRDCSVLKSVTIPNSVINIGYDAFGYCSNLTSVIIPNSITSIGSYAFSRSGLTSVTLSNNLTTIETDVFMDCSNLTSVIIPNSITSIRGSAFQGCSGMTSVTFGNGIKSIGDLAFCDCNALTNITIPNSVTSIGVAPFSGCDNLTSINVTSDNTNYCSIDGVLFSKDKTALIQYPCGKQGTYTIPNSVISIGEMAFAYCPTLSSITIPSNVTSIDQWAFDSNSLNSITNYATNPQAIHTNVFSHVDKSTCTLYVPAQCLAAYKAADVWKEFGNILSIDESGIEEPCILASGTCGAEGDNLTWTLSCDSVLTISGTGAMDDYYSYESIPWYEYIYTANSIKSVIIQEGVTHIGQYAFRNCHLLASVSLANSLTSIGGGAFSYCGKLPYVKIPSSVTNLGIGVFEGCPSMSAFEVSEANPNFCSVDGVLFDKNISTLMQYPPSKTNTTYSIPSNVVTIAETAFWCSRNLTIVTIPNGVASIGSSAFLGCSGLTSVTIPNSVATIGQMPFVSCTNLPSIDVDPGNPYFCSIDGVLFNKDKTNLIEYPIGKAGTSYVIPDGVIVLGNGAFEDCTSLISVTIPSSVESIGDFCFAYCRNLRSVTNYATLPQNIIGAGLSADTLYVPAQSVEAYKAADVWKEFTNILSIGESSDSCVIASGTCGAEGDNLTWTLTCDSVLTISGTGAMADYVASNSISPAPWYTYSTSINLVIIENGVTSIGNNAFYLCSDLTSIDIPNSVTSIGSVAFGNCSSLTSVTIPNSVTSIGIAAFYVCNGLTSVHISDIAAWCTISFGDYIANPLCHAHNLYVNEELVTDLVIPESVTSIGSRAFSNYSGLTSVTIGNSVTSIGSSAFDDCSGLTSVTIGNSVTSIGSSAFDGCSGLTSVTIPNSVTSIGNNAFAYCSGLTSVHISDIAAWCAISFGDASANPLNNGHNLYVNEELVTDLVIPNSVTSIGSWVFSNCSGLTSVTIPNSVTSIGWSAFSNCSSLTSVTIPNSVTSIGGSAFYKCTGLTSVTIPNSVTSIGEYAFYNCSVLTSIINYAIEPQTINSNVFTNVDKSACTLYVPAESVDAYKAAEGWKEFGNILAIEDEPAPCILASGTCGAEGDNLTWTLTCDSVLTISGTGAMADYQNATQSPWNGYSSLIQSVIMNDNVSTVSNYAFAFCSNLKNVSLNQTLTTIGEHAFFSCPLLESVVIPDNVIVIGYNAFAQCSWLTSVRIGNKVTTIGKDAFARCGRLSSVVMFNSVTSIGENAFDNCSALTTINIPNSITSIGKETFAFCAALTSIEIPESVTSIGENAFYGCSGLTSVTIGNSVTSIGDNAFYNCSVLTSITNYAIEPQTINSNVFTNVDKSTCTLYVPAQSLAAYQTADVWKEFFNILPIEGTEEPVEAVEGNYTIYYEDKDSQNLTNEVVTLHVPVAPVIEGFTFVEWWVVEGSLSLGITIQAVYKASEPTSVPEIYTNPANSAQKLIRNGNVYILTDDKVYTITGQKIQSY